MIQEISLKTTKHEELIDITENIKNIVNNSKIKNGICVIYTPHATAGITINENADPNIPRDILDALDEIVPDREFLHDRIDGNGRAHIKSSIIGVSKTIPIKEGILLLGRWQDIFLCEFDGPRERKIIVSINEDKR